ncbi:hypothetical protein RB195_025098 [Necator americanus]|uniref:Uncharacterized protein n=1 Tax=Necator americanus TaxID=51031 RepID=A0ABR1ERF2_NECAM
MWFGASFGYLRRLRSNIKLQEEHLEAFYMDLEKFYRQEHMFYKVIINYPWELAKPEVYCSKIDRIIVSKRFCLTDAAVVLKFFTGSDHRLLRGRFSFTRREEKAAKFRERNPRTTINWDFFATLAGFWEDSAMDNINEEYDRLVEHLHDARRRLRVLKPPRDACLFKLLS